MIKTHNTYQRFLKIEPWLHFFIWSVVLFYPYIKYAEREGGYMMSFSHELNSLVFKMTISYFLYFWFFTKKNMLKSVPFVLIAVVANILLYEFFDDFFHSEKSGFLVYFLADLLTYTGFGIVFFAMYSTKNSFKRQAEIELLSAEKQEAELRALKAQVNPHFLFNTLNTLYANALKKDDRTPELILKLSDSYRYLLHEGQNDCVTMQQEVQHLQDYIHLQEVRLAKKTVTKCTYTIDDEECLIAPLLLIGFVENAFKYTSMLKGQGHRISIDIVLKDNQLTFESQNPYAEQSDYDLDKVWKESGVGIESTKSRLQLLYPEKYELTIAKAQGQFAVILTIQL